MLAWFDEAQPDVACLQEIKCVDEKFPREPFEALGYNVAVHGQKTYNGVALLSKTPLEDVRNGLPGDDADDHARYIEAVVSTADGAVRVACIYLPNGNPLGTDKFAYKLGWMERLNAHARELLALEEPLVLAGDYNVIPDRGRRRQSGRLDGRRAVPAGDARRVPRAEISASPTPTRHQRRRRAATPSGTIRPAPGSGTTASASTTCCSRRRPPTAWPASPSTATCGPGQALRPRAGMARSGDRAGK